ncbi:MAG TPA: DUF1259 domain-containing protein [Chthoniobacterales bacterium]
MKTILRTCLPAVASVTALLFTSPGAAVAQDKQSGSAQEPLPVSEIEHIVGVQGDIANGVLDLSISRTDIGDVQGPLGVVFTPAFAFTPAFEINGDVFFQPLSQGQVFLNGDLPLKEAEVKRFISALLKNGLTFQAFHQHVPMHPQVWFIHFRGVGDPLVLARAVRAALNATGTPLPQAPPSNPTTPLDAQRLGGILHGSATVGEEGVVTVWVYRRDQVTIDGVRVNPQANISTNVEFKPLGGSTAAVVADFSMENEDVDPVVELMLNHLGWYQGCLYNQETGEHPQLYFDHMVKVGDACQLAAEIRKGLDLTDAQ